jgi:hypothetical protein
MKNMALAIANSPSRLSKANPMQNNEAMNGVNVINSLNFSCILFFLFVVAQRQR